MTISDKRYDVFISYAHLDDSETEKPITRLVGLLKQTYSEIYKEEIKVFFDVDREHGLQAGDLWENKLLESLRQSAVMIVVLSSDYYNSEYCRKEWRYFMDVEIHYSLPGEGIIPKKYVDPQQYGEFKNSPETVEPEVSVWIQDLQKRQYFDISDWKADRNAEAFKQRLVDVCEKVHERKKRLAERKKIPSNVRPHNENFTGRALEIRQIHEALTGNKQSIGIITSIKGIGGIGKSTIAYEYAHAYIDKYHGGTFNFCAEGVGDFRTALVSIAATTGMEFTEEERKNLDLQCQRVWQMISQGPLALLILDNVDDAAILSSIWDYAPDRHKLHILVTSRQGFISGDDIEEIQIPPLEQSLSLHLLLKWFAAKNKAEENAANAIAERLGGHPLALTMVGTYLKTKKTTSYAAQLQWLEDQGIGMLDGISGKIRIKDYARPVPTQIFEQVFSLLTPAEMRALEYAALLPPDVVPMPWLFEFVKEEFPEVVPNPKQPYLDPWEDIVRNLERLQLVIPVKNEPLVGTMHRLIQDAIRRRHDRNQEYTEQVINYAESRAQWFRDGGWMSRDDRWEIAPLTSFSLHYLAEDNVQVMKTANLTAIVEQTIGRWTETRQLLEETIRVDEKIHGADSPTSAFWYSNLGISEQDLGNLEEAERQHMKSIEIGEKHFDYLHPYLAIWYSNLGNVEHTRGNFVAAKQIHDKAIEVGEKHFVPDHPNLAICYFNLGIVERELGNLTEAKRLIEKSIEIEKKHFPLDHPNLAFSYSSLGLVEKDLGNFSEARRILEQAIEIGEKHFDSDHPHLAIWYSNLGLVEKESKNFEEAKRLLEKAIEIGEKRFEPDHPYLAIYYSNLGLVEKDLGNVAEAEQFLAKAAAINKKHGDSRSLQFGTLVFQPRTRRTSPGQFDGNT